MKKRSFKQVVSWPKDIVAGDWLLAAFGLSGATVFYRAMWCTLLVSTTWYLFFSPYFDRHFAAVAIGSFWAVFSQLRADFGSKFLDLEKRRDAVAIGWFQPLINDSGFVLSYEAVEFAETCLLFKMHRHILFRQLYDEVLLCAVIQAKKDADCFYANLRFSDRIKDIARALADDDKADATWRGRFETSRRHDKVLEDRTSKIERRQAKNSELRTSIESLKEKHAPFVGTDQIDSPEAKKIRDTVVSLAQYKDALEKAS